MLLHHAQTKIKQPLCVGTRELSDGWVRVDVASRAVFALSSATAPQLFESARPVSFTLLQNKNLSVLTYVEVFWWARVDSNHRS
ncbi:hypothetical protein DWY95_14065 [Faecalibacterium sp. AF28-13AC]|jgi:hypothetical protein|nr:hypothetical protein DWY95_14065 [Faecalibacterium sp. AF28-13AC]